MRLMILGKNRSIKSIMSGSTALSVKSSKTATSTCVTPNTPWAVLARHGLRRRAEDYGVVLEEEEGDEGTW